MSITWKSNNNKREENKKMVREFLKSKKIENPNYRVLDIGGVANPWADQYVDTYLDIVPVQNKDVIIGDIQKPEVWEEVKSRNFDFIICSHTLEDIVSTEYVIDKILECSKNGFISMPNKHTEMSHVESLRYLGYMHHQYIFTIQGETLIALRKSVALCNFIRFPLRILGFDFLAKVRRIIFRRPLLLYPYSSKVKWLNKNINSHEYELAFIWNDKFDFKYLNNNFIPSTQDYLNFVEKDLEDGY